jgi:hypothetical protein
MIVQTEEKDYARDLSSKALINTNVRALEEYKMRKEQSKKLSSFECEIQSLKDDMSEIKSLLTQLINR